MSNATEQIFLLSPPVGQPTSGFEKAPGPAASQQINLHDVKDFSSVCRTCATVTQYVIPIFEGDGLLNKLAEKIHKHLPIQVNEKDVLPRVMCYQCASTLLAWHELVQCCVQADAALRTRLAVAPAIHPSPTSRPGTNSQVLASPPVEVGTAGPGASFSSKVIAASTSTAADAASAEERLGRGTQTEPEMCAENAANQDDKREQHPAFKWNWGVKRESSPERLGNACASTLLSDDELDSIDDDDRPLATMASKNTDMYSNFYTALVNFRNHFVQEHGPERRPQYIDSSDSEIASNDEGGMDDTNVDSYDDLTQCNMRKDRLDENTRVELNEVQTKINGKVFYTCRTCGKNLSSPHTYVFHKRIHTGERPCVCHVCGKQFRAPNGLQRHLTETHERARRHACRLCLKDFANTQNLKQHLRIHTGERPHECGQCGKRFAQSGSLYVHLKTHGGPPAFACAECGASFRLRSSLARHALRHSGERPHACDCGRRFRSRHELTSHALSHSDVKPFSCLVCGAAFRQRRALRHHTKRVHEVPGPPREPPPEITHSLVYTCYGPTE